MIFFAAFLALVNGYVAHHIADRWGFAQAHLFLFWLGAVLYFLCEISWLTTLRLMPPHGQGGWRKKLFVAANYVSFLALGVFSCQFMFTFAGDIIGLVLHFAKPDWALIADQYNLEAVCGLTLLTTVIGMFQAYSAPQVLKVDVPLKNLPAAFEGFTIAQISDLHISPIIGRDYAEKVVRIANGLKPDLVALTGDFIDGTVDQLQDDIAPLAQLSAPFGMWFITGNHEMYWHPYAWMEHFKKLGAQVLNNRHELIRKGNDAIILAGVADYSTARSGHPDASDPVKALAGAPGGLVKILLAHQPASYKAAKAAGVDLQLSGHTHSGQYFPFTLVIRFFQRYYKGLNNHEGMWIYVNTGTGFWGPPLRTFVPPEITLLRLIKAS